MKDNRVKHALENIARRGVPENINLMPQIAARLERKSPMTSLRTRPVVALLIALFILLALTGVAYAVGRVFGYIPSVGLVENANGMQILEAPVSVTRDNVTLTVTQALVYPDHVQLVYEVNGIAPEDNSATFSGAEMLNADDKDFCGPASSSRGGYLSDGDPFLRLPDGTMIDRVAEVDKYPENVFAMKPAFYVSIPAEVTELTMVLKCIPWTRLGAVPEDWEIPLKLTHVPAGEVIGQPVLEVTPSQSSSVSDKGIVVALDKVVPQKDLYSFYVSIMPDGLQTSPSMLYPASASMTDSTGQTVPLLDMQPFPGMHDFTEPWELQTVAKPAYGPYTLTLDRIFAYYNITPVTFEFDAGTNPELGQAWEIGQVLHLDGADVKVLSARMVEKDLTMWGMSPNMQGFEYSFEVVDGKTPVQLDIMDFNLDHIMNGVIPIPNGDGQPAPTFSISLFYEEGVPTGNVQVAVNRQTVMYSGNWKFQWTSPDEPGVDLLDSSQAISSQPDASGVSAELKRVVKLDDGYLFYLHMNVPDKRTGFRVMAPETVYVIDSAGHKIKLQMDSPQVFSATDKNLLQYSTNETIVTGPLKVVVEGAKAYYNAHDMSVPPASDIKVEPHFTFDVGETPQVGLTWDLGNEFELSGYNGKVLSVRAITVDSKLLPFPELQPDQSINSGYEFTIQSLDPAIQWNVGVLIDKPQGSSEYVDCIGYLPGDSGTTTTHTVTCRGLPGSELEVTIYEVSILSDGVWEIDWNLPSQ